MNVAERIAREFHEARERKAPDLALRDRPVGWQEMPHRERVLLRAVVAELLERGVIRPGPGA